MLFPFSAFTRPHFLSTTRSFTRSACTKMLKGLDLYKCLTEIPVYTEAVALPPINNTTSHSRIRVVTSVVDHERNLKRQFAKTIVIDTKLPELGALFVSEPQEIGPETMMTRYSPSGRKRAVLKEYKDEESGGKRRFVEVWDGEKLEVIKEVTKVHEDFYTDDTFGCLSFSPSETSLVWTAEKPRSSVSQGKDDNSVSSQDSPASKFRYVPHFGELYKGRREPSLFILDWASEENTGEYRPKARLYALDIKVDLSATTVFGQAIFATETLLYATGYSEMPNGRKLGIRGCNNRPSAIYRIGITFPDASVENDDEPTKLETQGKMISDLDKSSRSPRLSGIINGKRHLVWISNAFLGPHASCSKLHGCTVDTSTAADESNTRVIIDTIQLPKDSNSFPGLYLDQLPNHPFNDNGWLYLTTVWGSRKTSLAVDMRTGKNGNTGNGPGFYVDKQQAIETNDPKSRSFLGHVSGNDCCSIHVESKVGEPSKLVLAIPARESDFTEARYVTLDEVDVFPDVKEQLKTIRSKVIQVPMKDGSPFETIVITSRDVLTTKEKPPCISLIHGGPHTTALVEFVPPTVALALQGFTIAMPNYTGSLGFGQERVEAIIGKSGYLDVEECIATSKFLVKEGYASDGPGKQLVSGGSHGGFLTAHLISKYPGFFGAAVLRNPVIAISELASTSDIPDWSYSQFGIPYDAPSPGFVNQQVFEKLQAASPIAYAESIRTPVLLLIGEDDQRVPPSQGKALYHYLKGQQREVEMLMFPKNSHPLDKVEPARVAWKEALDWFNKVAKF